jgi:hypothetical protein
VSQKQQDGLAQQELSDEREAEAVQSEAGHAGTEAELPAMPLAANSRSASEQGQGTSGSDQPISSAGVAGKKRKKSKHKWVSVDEISPKPSFWPLATTISISVLLMGIMVHPIMIGVGVLLLIASIMGWMLERR